MIKGQLLQNMTYNYSKLIRKKLRELAGLAHERELSMAMETLDKHFAQWRRQEIDCFELNDRIHRFHQNTSSEAMENLFFHGRRFPCLQSGEAGFFVQGRCSGESCRGHIFGQACI